jgi:hypothetical protein
MKPYLCCTLLLLVFPTLLVAQTGKAAPKDSVDEVEKKLREVRKQIEDIDELRLSGRVERLQILTHQDVANRVVELRRQEQTLLKARERFQKEAADEAEKRDYYAKVEIKGRLRKETISDHVQGVIGHNWAVSIDDLTWYLDLGNNKELLAVAEQQAGKPVVVTGKVVGRAPLRCLTLMPTIVVDSLKAAEK